MEKEICYLKTKSIHAPISPKDGYRISVMSRHTLNDGVTPDQLITLESFHLWMKELAPIDSLVGLHYKRNLPWNVFEEEYVKFLEAPKTLPYLDKLLQLIKKQTVTLLCVEDSPEYCHRRLLAEKCQKYIPGLRLIIK